MTKRTLADLKNAFGDSNQQKNDFTSNNNYYPFWNMDVNNRAVIRFLPDLDLNNPRGFLVEKLTHILTINGKKQTVPCLAMYGEECPICKASKHFYDVKDEINGKALWRKKSYLGQCIVIEDPLAPNPETGETHEGQVRAISLSYQIYSIIKEAFSSDELESIPYEFEGGSEFVIKKSQKGKYAEYNIGTKFNSRSRDLTSEELSIAESGMVELHTLLPKNPGAEKVKALLDAHLNGGSYQDNAGFDDDAPFVPTRKVSSKVEEPVAPVQQKKVETTDDSNSDDVDQMLAAIRARRKISQ